MTEPIAFGETILSLLDEGALSATYKPALLLALVDETQAATGAGGTADRIPVRALAERVAELYFPQTRPFPETGIVLRQNSGQQATIVKHLLAFRREVGANEERVLHGLRSGAAWERLIDRVELSLAEMPVPRLQVPYGAFLYEFGWSWAGNGGWRVGEYRRSTRSLLLRPGAAEALVTLGPLLRPFILRLWAEKAASLNPNAVPGARAVHEFERFLFGSERSTLTRLTADLATLQDGGCFYCRAPLAGADVDHFVPWSYGADDGLDNLVAACPRCNNGKRAILAGPRHVAELRARNERMSPELDTIALRRAWVRDPIRTTKITRAAYLVGSDERRLWELDPATNVPAIRTLGSERAALLALLG